MHAYKQSFEMENQEVQCKSTTKMGFTGVCHLEMRWEVHRMLSVCLNFTTFLGIIVDRNEVA
jgi:hypothetical protein